MNDVCIRCGQCCHLVINNKPSNVPCPYLKFDGLQATCTVYNSRLNRPLGKKNRCIPRQNSMFDFEGCPYNTIKPRYRVTKNKVVRIC